MPILERPIPPDRETSKGEKIDKADVQQCYALWIDQRAAPAPANLAMKQAPGAPTDCGQLGHEICTPP
eukprot:1121033-Pelagomonas_calceolata.AAC.3